MRTLATRWFGVTLLAARCAARLTQQQIDAGLATMNEAAAINALAGAALAWTSPPPRSRATTIMQRRSSI